MSELPTRPAGRRAARQRFDPRVLVFACNWCSYAGADTAGVSRLAQTPHFRLLRVMCSGRIHPAFVLRAFARGADAVMVSGCHFGDCHYMFGNHRAVEQFEKTRALCRLLGLEPERLRLEWISAAEGVRFARIMDEFVEQARQAGRSPAAPAEEPPGGFAAFARAAAADPAGELLLQSGALGCLECGRCTAVCPVARYQRFSPRRLISRALAGGAAALARDDSLWSCLTCNRCHAVCPVRIPYGEFVIAARAALVRAQGSPRPAPGSEVGLWSAETGAAAPAGGNGDEQASRPARGVAPCSHGGVFEQVSLMHTRPGLRQDRLEWLGRPPAAEVVPAGGTARARDLFWTGCSPYFAAYFGGQTGAGLTGALRAGLRLLAEAGIRPAVLADERCCGHHARLSGRAAEADALAALVAAQIRASGVRRVITPCPECRQALREACASHDVDVAVVHLSEVLAAQLEPLRAAAREAGEAGPAVTFQDPCRLGLHAGVYDAPRRLLDALGRGPRVEMAHSRERAVCCGNTAWLACNAATRQMQAARLEEARAAGARRLATACPGCFIHLRCAQEGAPPGGADEIEITDLWSLLAEALPAAPEAATHTDTRAENQRGSA
jgi:heterodisulfide reductase subunit D